MTGIYEVLEKEGAGCTLVGTPNPTFPLLRSTLTLRSKVY